MLQLEKKEQESLEKAKQYAAQKRELKKRQKDVETKKRTHRLCQIGGAVESVLGSAIEEDDIPKLIAFPMNGNAQDLMCGAPGEVTEQQLREVHIKVRD